MDGEANWVSGLLQEKDPSLARGAETASDHASLQLAGVPSVLLMQNGEGYLYHSAADTGGPAGPVRHRLRGGDGGGGGGGDLLLRNPLLPGTGPGAGGGVHLPARPGRTSIYFSSSRADTEAYIGAAGEPADSWEVSGGRLETDAYETYRYSMRWFDGETPMNTYYQYRNGFLERIAIRPEETGYPPKEVRGLIEAMYGAPEREEDGQASWADPVYSKYITLSSDEEGWSGLRGQLQPGASPTCSPPTR